MSTTPTDPTSTGDASGAGGPSVAIPVSTKIPPAVEHPFPDGSRRTIQVNFCKNPACKNFGVPASLRKYAHRKIAPTLLPGTEYTLASYSKDTPVLVCRLCRETPPLKSNLGISEELARLSSFLKPPEGPSCPNEACASHGVPVNGSKALYHSIGKTGHGSQRYKCRACGKTFSTARASTRQRYPQKNLTIFKLLMNKSPMSRICEVADIAPKTFYDRLAWFHRQCLAFAAAHERKLFEGMQKRRLYVAVDRQDYTINWAGRKDKRNVVLRALGSADLDSGYVFGMHLNFDSRMDPARVEAEAVAVKDYKTQYPFRRHARLWLEQDYARAVMETMARATKRGKKASKTLGDDISEVYADAAAREDVESPEEVSGAERFPSQGMQVHNEYTMYGHFFYLRQLFRGVEKVRFFVDQESGIRAACLAAFEQEIRDGNCETFYLRLGGKEMTVDEKRKLITASRAEFKKWQDAYPKLKPSEVETLMMRAEMDRAAAIGKWSDKWLMHPFPNSAEPLKAMCFMTDRGQYVEDPADPVTTGNADHLARLFLKASLHPIDRFFMQVRRRLSMLERPIGTSSKAGRTWFGYSAYRPENIEAVLNIFRVFYNYCLAGKDKKTPAMRLGLAEKVMRPQDILYFI